jgi:hypothetical protein
VSEIKTQWRIIRNEFLILDEANAVKTEQRTKQRTKGRSMKSNMKGLICALAAGTALLQPNLAGAQATKSGQAKLAENIAEIRTETVRTHNQLQATMDALNALTAQKTGDLRPTYEAFAAAVKNTHAAADQTAARKDSMQTASKDYFGAWGEQVAGIAKESLRKKAQKRLDTVRKSYDKVIGSLREAAEKFKPLLSNLDDVQKTLANDVTPGGVKAVRSTANDANSNMKKVRWSINEAVQELMGMEKELSSQSEG